MDLSAVGSELVAEEPIVESIGPDPHVVVQLQQVGFPGSCSILLNLSFDGVLKTPSYDGGGGGFNRPPMFICENNT